MFAPVPTRLNYGWPVITLLLLGAALAVAWCPGLAPALIYDRPAILAGESWRLFTGHWVHFSSAHLAFDLVALGVAGAIAETRSTPRFGWLCLVAPWSIGAVTLVLAPDMRYCGGLSGLAVAVLVLLALSGLGDSRGWRRVWLAVLIGVAAKLGYELVTGHTAFADPSAGGAVVCVASHFAGAGTALIIHWLPRLRHTSFIKPAGHYNC